MPRYNVIMPCTMSILLSVEAENKEAAKNAAFQLDFSIEISGEGEPEILEFESHETVCRGNIFCGVLNEIEVEDAE